MRGRPGPDCLPPLPVAPWQPGRVGGYKGPSPEMPTELKHDGRRPDMDVSSQFQDSKLVRQQGYIEGQWVGADGGGTDDVANPADGRKVGTDRKSAGM